ncbi:MAG TPA: hypothetical protein VEC12_02285, partial [Bacteroidia bacterium]|nr:hypothetical protein [Bacteroidia bacterium]
TAGYEALYKGKPCLMFGYFFYNYAPGVLHIRTNEQCAAAVKKITSGEQIFDVRDLKFFLKAVEVCTFRGGILSESVAYLDYDDETAARVMTDEFIRKFREEGVLKNKPAAAPAL